MSVLLLDSFDDGLWPTKWTGTGWVGTGNAPGPSTAGPRTGTHKCDLTGGDAAMYRELGTGSHATVIVAMGYSVSDIASVQQRFLYFLSDGGATNHISFRQIGTGGLDIYRGDTIIGTTAPNIIQSGTWYHLEVKVVLHDTTGSVEIRVNDTSVFTFNGDTKNAGTEAVISRIRIGGPPNVVASNRLSVDDVCIMNGAGTSNNNFKGNSRIHNLLPDANGNYSQFLGSDADSVNNYLLVDETPPNTTDYVGSGTSGQKDSYNFPSVPAPTTQIFGVGQRAYAATSDAGPRAARNLVRIGGVDYVGADYNLGSSYLLFETLYDVSPATTVAFTPAEFNAAEWGIECRA